MGEKYIEKGDLVFCLATRFNASENIDYVLLVLEWLRKGVLATWWDEGRGDSCLGFPANH
ncbi:MAG: hypothetical protein C0508_01580 [Cyanobacteria bacterium PR.023]|nr:hypothetical protein [Cyanobacteria bacterium DS2.008]MBA4073700.1 hypothetical protein [Cyanobacteria bacterium PR.023]